VIIEDIVDTGLTLHRFLQKVHEMEPADVRIAACC
jgi:hypoxanthine-guanine phosphoribosyltransferase